MTDIDSRETSLLLDRAADGDRSAVNGLMARYRAELRRVLGIRIAPKLQKRVDASDIIQETEIEVFERFDDYLARRPMPFRLWLRKTALQRLAKVRERHIKAAKRSVEDELSLSAAASAQLCRRLVRSDVSPSQRAMQRELINQVKMILSEFSDTDREILLMRHVEKMSNVEIGHVLDLSPSAVSKRHVRCLVKLRSMLHQRGIKMSGP